LLRCLEVPTGSWSVCITLDRLSQTCVVRKGEQIFKCAVPPFVCWWTSVLNVRPMWAATVRRNCVSRNYHASIPHCTLRQKLPPLGFSPWIPTPNLSRHNFQ